LFAHSGSTFGHAEYGFLLNEVDGIILKNPQAASMVI